MSIAAKEKRAQLAELKRLRQAASTIYEFQLRLPASERDVDLIGEALETLEYTSAVLLSEKKVSLPQRVWQSGLMGRFGIAAAALALFIALGAGTVKALGFGFNVTIEGGEISIQITDDTQTDGKIAAPTDGFVTFDNVANAKKRLLLDPMLFDTDMYVKSVVGTASQNSTMLIIDYASDDGKYISYAIHQLYTADAAHSKFVEAGGSKFNPCRVGDLQVYISEGANETVVLWNDGSVVYQLNTNLDEKAVLALLETIA